MPSTIVHSFDTSIPLMSGGTFQLPVSPSCPLFIVGANGAGKSALLLSLFQKNQTRAVRVAAHRQTWMESNSIPFSPQDKKQLQENFRGQDSQDHARWKEWNSQGRAGLVIADLIEAENALARDIRTNLKSGNVSHASQLAETPSPLETINELFKGSGIAIHMYVDGDSAIMARKKGGAPFSIAALSDGERAALLMSGIVLAAKPNSLILVDEPERHLHASIATPLLLQLFAKRPDCTFVVSTHEIGLPVSAKDAQTVLVRDSRTEHGRVVGWDVDLLPKGADISDDIKTAVIGSRRVVLFIEGEPTSLDKPLYELLFPTLTIVPRASCGEVEHAVQSLRDAANIAWVKAFGIVDQDQTTIEKRQALETIGVYPLDVYSVEGLYYGLEIVEAVAVRQVSLIGGDASSMMLQAIDGFLDAVKLHEVRMSARMTEQGVKDAISFQMPNWKDIQGGADVAIAVDAKAMFQAEQARLRSLIDARDVGKIVKRYPIRETPALGAVVSALQFRSRDLYEAAVRKLVADDPSIRAKLLAHFGGLVAALN